MSRLTIFLLILCASITSQASTLEFTVHHGPGGPSDKATRIIAQHMPNRYVVVNRPGAQGRIAIKQVLSNDSLIIATMTQIFVTNMLSNDPGYSDSDLEILGIVGVMPSILICNKKHDFQTYKDFLNYRGDLNFGVAGYGSSEHLSTEILLKQYNNNHQIIPYPQGGSTSLVDLLAGNIDCMFANYPLVIGHLTDHRLRVLMTSHQVLPNVTTWNTFYKEEFPVQSLLGIIVNKNLDNKTKQKILNDIALSFSNKQLVTNIESIGLFPILSTSKTAVNRAIVNNEKTKAFILKHNLRLN
jgi:tripartite-type tricarboxylate transporter receptor subunit TctC